MAFQSSAKKYRAAGAAKMLSSLIYLGQSKRRCPCLHTSHGAITAELRQGNQKARSYCWHAPSARISGARRRPGYFYRLGVLFLGVLIKKSLTIEGLCIRAPDFWKLAPPPNEPRRESGCRCHPEVEMTARLGCCSYSVKKTCVNPCICTHVHTHTLFLGP